MGRSLNSFEQHYPSVAHLRHESIRTCVLLIFEDDIGIVVRCELFKALRGPGDLALVSPTGSQCLFGYIWNKLLVIKGCQFLWRPPFPMSPPRPTALVNRCENQGAADEEPKHHGETHSTSTRQALRHGVVRWHSSPFNEKLPPGRSLFPPTG